MTADIAEECIKTQSKITFENNKQFKTEVIVGRTITIYSPKKWEKRFIKPLHIGFTTYGLSKLFRYKTF